MWFVRITATPQGQNRTINIITEMTCLSLNDGEQQWVYPTQFFIYFKDCPRVDAFSDLPTLKVGEELLRDLLEEEKREEGITTA